MACALSAHPALCPSVRRRGRGPGPWGPWALVLVLVACNPAAAVPTSIPPAAAYDAPSNFEGEWLGEVDGMVGNLSIKPLGSGRYRGLYEGEEIDVEYVLSLQQDMKDVGGQPLPANRALFTWQDGRGGRGEGWLLINREDSALTGAFGERGELDRTWTFIRVE